MLCYALIGSTITTMGKQERIRVFEAIYEDGVLKPVNDPGLPEHRRFSVQVEDVADAADAAGDALAAWRRVYEGLSPEDQAAVELIALDRSRFSSGQTE
jgi:predicted DNA-binding antitoxin AbrB/MazE fold protein